VCELIIKCFLCTNICTTHQPTLVHGSNCDSTIHQRREFNTNKTTKFL